MEFLPSRQMILSIVIDRDCVVFFRDRISFFFFRIINLMRKIMYIYVQFLNLNFV